MKSATVLKFPDQRNMASAFGDQQPPRKKQRKERNYLTDSEAEALLKATKETRNPERDHAMMLLALRHGLRVSELISVRLSDIDLEGCTIYVRRLKGSVSNEHMLDADEIRALRKWLQVRKQNIGCQSEWLFLSERGDQFSRFSINSLVKMLTKRASIQIKAHPHTLRHTTGRHLAKIGTNAFQIQRQLGHRSFSNTLQYVDISDVPLQRNW